LDLLASTGASTSNAQRPVGGLTVREIDVIRLLSTGKSNREIARALFVSEKTVSSHVSNLLRKTGTANRVDLARLARRRT
jgi:DNA-binding NarL/FixJ family response regulator